MRLLLLFMLACVLPLQADILVNANFADGRAHWKGDAEDIQSGDSTDLSGAGTTPAGVVIKLKKDKWTKIFQTFNVRDPKLFYTITFKLSPDYKLASHSWEDTSTPDFSDVPGFMGMWTLSERNWYLMIRGTDGFFGTSKYLQPDAKNSASQTLTGKVSDLSAGADGLILIAFPPGDGSITLLNISLSPNDPNADP